MDWQALFQTLGVIAAPALAIFGFGTREKVLREHILGDLALIEKLNENPILKNQTASAAWLHGKVVVDVAKLAREPLGTKKRPIPVPSFIFGLLTTAGFTWWTYEMSKDGFAWGSLATGTVAALSALGSIGMLMNRSLPPDEALPPGAVAISSETATERVAGRVALAAMVEDGRFAEGGAVAVALDVFESLQLGLYESALESADPLWIECRVRSWLWNNRAELAASADLDELLHAMLEDRDSHELWESFVEAEGDQFESEWEDLGRMGAGSARRRMSRDIELVVLAPVGGTEGYFVSNPTIVPNALRFLMRETEDGWRLLNHVGLAAPIPEWPPIWWLVNDDAIVSDAPPLEVRPA